MMTAKELHYLPDRKPTMVKKEFTSKRKAKRKRSNPWTFKKIVEKEGRLALGHVIKRGHRPLMKKRKNWEGRELEGRITTYCTGGPNLEKKRL